MDLRRFLADGIKVGLGSDVAGGHSASMLDVIRHTLVASRALGFQQREAATPVLDLSGRPVEYPPMTYREAFYLATVGSAGVLNMDRVVGNFLPGKCLDCLVVDIAAPNSPIDT